jgi:hypothetical protein
MAVLEGSGHGCAFFAETDSPFWPSSGVTSIALSWLSGAIELASDMGRAALMVVGWAVVEGSTSADGFGEAASDLTELALSQSLSSEGVSSSCSARAAVEVAIL